MKWYLGWMVKLYFRRIYAAGLDLVPDGQPAIFASNHPAGFIEPIILATNVRQPIHFLVLGSFLKSPYLQWFFRGVKMVPIYRRDIAGSQSIEKNKSTFEYVYRSLEENSHILIYPEAKTHFIYKVRPLRKGIVRMARGFLKRKTHEAVYIVPVGVNFIWPSRFRSDVFIDVGNPIKIDDIGEDENTWYVNQLKEVSEAMKEVVFEVADEKRHPSVQHLVQIYHNQRKDGLNLFTRTYQRSAAQVKTIREMVTRLNNMKNQHFDMVEEKLQAYIGMLDRAGVKDETVNNTYRFGIGHLIFTILGFPFFISGSILNMIGLLAGYFAKSSLVKRIEYKAAVAATVPAILTLIFFVVLLVLGFVVNYGLLILAFVIPMSLYLTIYYLDLISLLFQKVRYRFISNSLKDSMEKTRSELMSMIDQ